MREMKKIFLGFAMLAFVGAFAQKPTKEKIQENIEEVYSQYSIIDKKVKNWHLSNTRISLDSIELLRENHANPLLAKAKNTAKYSTVKESVILHFYYLNTSVDLLKIYQKNKYYEEAKKFSQNYKDILGYKPMVDGQATTNGVLRNLNKEKIEILQYNYLIQLYNMANSLSEKPLQKYTSIQMVENPRASLYNQVVATLYLFRTYHEEKENKTALIYGDKFLTKYSNLSFENREKFKSNDAYYRLNFVKEFYAVSRAELVLKNKEINSQVVSKYLEIGRKYTIPGMEIHMQGLLVDLKEITSKKEIEELQKIAEKGRFILLSQNLKESLKSLKSQK